MSAMNKHGVTGCKSNDDEMATGGVVVLGIAGGTGAGKTTLSRRLFDALGGDDHVAYLVHDYYYKDLNHLSFTERVQCNFDHPNSLDTALLVTHLQQLKAGQTVPVPRYDFSTHSRLPEPVCQSPRKIIIVEGILILCECELVKQLDIKVYVDADADIRLFRRISRDCHERGRTVEQVLTQYHETVRPMHQEYVEPSKREADLIVHSHGHSMQVAIAMMTNHLRVLAKLDNFVPFQTTAENGNAAPTNGILKTADHQQTDNALEWEVADESA